MLNMMQIIQSTFQIQTVSGLLLSVFAVFPALKAIKKAGLYERVISFGSSAIYIVRPAAFRPLLTEG
jgi:hypothetical protein